MKQFLLLIAGALMLAAPLQAATLQVTVRHLEKKGGMLHVALYTEDIWDEPDADPLMDRIVPVKLPATTVTFENVPPGIYGVKTYQDTNENDKFDQDLIGIPEERFGFSRDARPGLSEPFFTSCSFPVKDDTENAITIHLQ